MEISRQVPILKNRAPGEPLTHPLPLRRGGGRSPSPGACRSNGDPVRRRRKIVRRTRTGRPFGRSEGTRRWRTYAAATGSAHEAAREPGASPGADDPVASIQGVECPASRPVRAILFVAEHPVADHGVSAYPAAVTAAMVESFATGGAGSADAVRRSPRAERSLRRPPDRRRRSRRPGPLAAPPRAVPSHRPSLLGGYPDRRSACALPVEARRDPAAPFRARLPARWLAEHAVRRASCEDGASPSPHERSRRFRSERRAAVPPR